jgi:4,5-dihydroxyphthalate decarboxylase
MGSRERHMRMARGQEFDVCEFNACAYFMARDRGVTFTALPVFPHRRFRHGFVFVNAAKGIREPKDLIGKRVGSTNFQPAGVIWMRGILEEHFGVPHRRIDWLTEREEDIPFDPAPGLSVSRVARGKLLDDMLAEGEIDAMISPEFPEPFLRGDPRIQRLFPDFKAREQSYVQQTGIFPIMHVTVVKRAVLDAHPWIAASLMAAFERAKTLAYERVANPRVVPLAWFTSALEEQRALLGDDPWEYGLTPAKRHNLATAIRYTREQGLISRDIPVDELFEAV